MYRIFQISLVIVAASGILILVLQLAKRRMLKACEYVINDLKKRKAFDFASAVELPYCRNGAFRSIMKDYRPEAVKALVRNDVVRMLAGDRYYLRGDSDASEFDGGSAESAPRETPGL